MSSHPGMFFFIFICTFNFSTTNTFPGTLLNALITSYLFSVIKIVYNFWCGELMRYHPLLLCEMHVDRTLRALISVGISAAGTE